MLKCCCLVLFLWLTYRVLAYGFALPRCICMFRTYASLFDISWKLEAIGTLAIYVYVWIHKMHVWMYVRISEVGGATVWATTMEPWWGTSSRHSVQTVERSSLPLRALICREFVDFVHWAYRHARRCDRDLSPLLKSFAAVLRAGCTICCVCNLSNNADFQLQQARAQLEPN